MQRPTLGLLECSRKCDMLALIPALTDFPCIDVDTTARDGHYQVGNQCEEQTLDV